MPRELSRRAVVALTALLVPVLAGVTRSDSGAAVHSGATHTGGVCDSAPDEVCVAWNREVQGRCPDQGDVRHELGACVPELGPAAFADGQCCYEVRGYSVTMGCGCVHGRPLLVEAQPLRAGLGGGREWLAPRLRRPDTRETSAEDRARLARFWASVAINEHASVASFHRAALDLLAVGAPARFVAAAQRGAADELRHARWAFTLASAFAGAPVGPAALEVPLPSAAPTLADVVARTVTEACVEETGSLAAAMVMRGEARDPAVLHVLERIVRDEQRHVVAAWSFVRWAVERDPALRQVAREAFASAAPLPDPERGEPGHLASFGCLGDDVLVPIVRQVRQQVVAPLAEALCA
jgi:hypothetical protein